MNALAPSILIFSTLLVQLSSGINYVTIPVVMTEQGYGHSLIGSAMAFEILGMLLLFKPLSSLVAQLGLRTCMGLLALMRAVSLMLMGHSESYPLWLFCIGLYGLATGMTLVMSQTWLNLLAQAKSRGVLMGLFSSALSCGVALGPLVLQLPWLNDGETFELNTWMTGLPCVLLLLCPRQGNTRDNIGKIRFSFAFRHAKVVLISAFIGGISFFGLPSFLALYGLANQLSEPEAQLLLTMFMLGSVTLGMLLSTGATFINRSSIVLACIFSSVVCAVYLSLAVYAQYWVAVTLLFFWGGAMGGIYAIGLTAIGERFCQQDQMSANMSHTIMDSLGGITGLLVIGVMFDWIGPEGMTSVFIACGSSLLVFFVHQLLCEQKTFD